MSVYTKIDQNNHLSQCLPNCENVVIQPSRNLLFTFKLWIDRTRQRKHLAQLDERMLQDIGLSRAQVNREIAKPFWR